MINAAPSLEAAKGLTGKEVAAYLGEKGWTARASKIDGVSIFSKIVAGGRPVYLVLPIKEGVSDELRRVADALRTVAEIERQPEAQIAEQIRSSQRVRASVAKGKTIDDDPETPEFDFVSDIETLSDSKIEKTAAFLRRALGLMDQPTFNVADVCQNRLSSVIDNFRFEFFAEVDKPNLLTYHQNVPPRIFCRREVFESAYEGDPAARYTLAHELGHVYLLSRWQYLSNSRRADVLRAMTVESSAHHFAIAFLIPRYLLGGMTDPRQISQRFNVSLAVAEERVRALRNNARHVPRGFYRLLDLFRTRT